MKTKAILFLLLMTAWTISCDDDEQVEDPIYEFISFSGDESVNLGEASDSEGGYPLTAQLWAFDPYPTDITVNFEVTGTNAQAGTDFEVTPANSVTIRAGNLLSDTIWVKTVNAETPNEEERTIEVKITSTSQPDLKIGLGLTEPKKSSVSFKIIDDECTGDARCVFNTSLTNTISGTDGSWSSVLPANGVVDKLSGMIIVTGDLISYAPFSNARLSVTLTPDSEGSATGTATFGEQEVGADADGYEYKFVEIEPGTYNGDTGVLHISYDIYYWDGGWIYWYSVENDFSPQ